MDFKGTYAIAHYGIIAAFSLKFYNFLMQVTWPLSIKKETWQPYGTPLLTAAFLQEK